MSTPANRAASSIRRTRAGAIAFNSASSGAAPSAAAADTISKDTVSAASGGTIERTASASRTTAARSGRSSSAAACPASPSVRSLRPSRVATTRTPPRASASASALPIAPGLTIPTVGIRRESTRQDRRVRSRAPAELVRDRVRALEELGQGRLDRLRVEARARPLERDDGLELAPARADRRRDCREIRLALADRRRVPPLADARDLGSRARCGSVIVRGVYARSGASGSSRPENASMTFPAEVACAIDGRPSRETGCTWCEPGTKSTVIASWSPGTESVAVSPVASTRATRWGRATSRTSSRASKAFARCTMRRPSR